MQRDAIVIHEQSHSNDRKRLVLFAFPISPQFIRLFQFKEVIRAVVIEDVLSPFVTRWLFLYSCAWIKSFSSARTESAR